MNKKQILNTIGDLLGNVRAKERELNDKIDSLRAAAAAEIDAIIVDIKEHLKTLYAAGVPRDEVMATLIKWARNVEDGKMIRSAVTLGKWVEAAGWRVRGERSDKGGVHAGGEVKGTKDDKKAKAIEKVLTLMKKHGITVSDLA